ncbi:hypothetical protein CASFOL_003084 [Castilleja foliolosa]|uniref:VWA-Hint protein Vwaint domain-containing protein n=1 Tax=Castilleja foliolosa TaxID=1961234 RepID=A0ABD3EGF5_9LAMI
MRFKGTYERVGRAYALPCISAHTNQRATTSGNAGSSNNAYVTPNMDNMVIGEQVSPAHQD